MLEIPTAGETKPLPRHKSPLAADAGAANLSDRLDLHPHTLRNQGL